MRPLAWALAALVTSGCATEQKIPWSEVFPGEARAPADSAPSPVRHEATPLPAGPQPPAPTVYAAPPGATLVATAEGPAALPARRLSAAAERAAGAGFEVVHSLAVDLDGDGADELLVLARRLGGGAFRVVAAALDGTPRASRGYQPILHRGKPCHLEMEILGILRAPEGPRPILWEDRGVGCTGWEGGGLERRLLLPPAGMAEGEDAWILLGSKRLVGPGAVDVYEAAAWVVEEPAGQRLVARGVWSARRSCDHGDAPFWVEEAVFRTVDGARQRVWGGDALLLPEGVLPPELLRSHPAACIRR